MDPVTHGIIGLGIAALSGEPTSINPITIGSVLGAMSPDIDIVVKYWGDYKYLKHHRGPTHSILSLLGISIIISTVLFFIFNDYSFSKIFIWTFLGCLSHTFFDGLNSYGVRPFMPFTKKKFLANILMLYDPILTALSLALVIINVEVKIKLLIALSTLVIYISFRLLMKNRVEKVIRKNYTLDTNNDEIHVLPDLTNFFKWDFIIKAQDYKIVGRMNYLNNKEEIITKLDHSNHSLIQKAHSTPLGKYFKEFTSSIVHTEVIIKDDKIVLKLIDLRYYLKNNFMHHATIEFNSDKEHISSTFHPYKIEKRIRIRENI